MRNFNLVFVFALVLMVKVAVAFGSDAEEVASSEDVLSEVSVSDVIPPRGDKIAYTDSENQVTAIMSKADLYEKKDNSQNRFGFQTLVGGTGWVGAWHKHIGNSLTWGVGMEIPLGKRVSMEIEGQHGKYQISYSNLIHDFTQSSLGSNAKFYATKGVISPYVGVGLSGLHYQNMSYGLRDPNSRYARWVGAGSLHAGTDIAVAQDVAIGMRASLTNPLFGRAETKRSGGYSLPGFEEAAAMDSLFYRLMGTVKVSL